MTNITFENNGVPFTFSDRYCGGGKHLMIDYSNVVAICLNVDIEKRGIGFFKRVISKLIPKYIIQIDYYSSSFNRDKISSKTIQIRSNEIEQAKTAIKMVENIIAQIKRQHEAEQIKLEKARQSDTIDCIDENGKHTKIWRRECMVGKYVLVADGGKTYHTHADCFESWKDWMRERFTGWKKISIDEAKAQGLTACKLCEKYYDFDEEDESNGDYDDKF